MDSCHVLLLSIVGCEILKTVTDVRLQVLESWPLREFSSFPMGLEPSCYSTIQGYFKPRFNQLKLKVRAEVLTIKGVSQEQVNCLASCTPRTFLYWKNIKKRLSLTVKPSPEAFGIGLWETGERELGEEIL